MSTKQKSMIWMLIPVMFSFFTMGFVDLVGIATNYVKADFQLSDTLANLLPSMVFFWFLIFSVPTGMLMNKIGQRKTVLLSIVVTVAALLLPLLNYSFASMLISFSLLGIGNTLMQVSLNPLLSNIVSGNRLASTLTLGQFVKAIASFLAPIIAGWAAVSWGNWKLLFLFFLVIAVIACVLLGMTHIDESSSVETKSSTFGECFALLADKVVLISFLGIICHVGMFPVQNHRLFQWRLPSRLLSHEESIHCQCSDDGSRHDRTVHDAVAGRTLCMYRPGWIR